MQAPILPIHLAKKALFGTSKSLPNAPTTSKLFCMDYFSRTTACHRAHERGNAIAEGRNVTSILAENTGDKKNTRTNYEARDQAQRINDDDDMSGVTSFVVDTSRQCVTKAMDRPEDVGEKVKEIMDSAFNVTKETTSTQNMKDTVVVVADTNVVDTTEYRSIQMQGSMHLKVLAHDVFGGHVET